MDCLGWIYCSCLSQSGPDTVLRWLLRQLHNDGIPLRGATTMRPRPGDPFVHCEHSTLCV